MKIAIFGATGFIGTALTKKLEDKHDLILFSKSNNLSSIHINGNFQNSADIEKVFNKQKIDIVIHLISTLIPSSAFQAYKKSLAIDLAGTTQLLESMTKHSVPKLIYLSSGGTVYGNQVNKKYTENLNCNPINYYGLSKLQIERLIQTYCHNNQIKHMVLRPSNAYGPNQNSQNQQGLIGSVLHMVETNNVLDIYGDGTIRRDYLYIDDLVEAISKIINMDKFLNDTINVATGTTHSVNDVIDLAEKVTNKKIKVRYLPSRSVDIQETHFSIKKLKTLLNWKPQIKLEIGLQLSYLKQKKNAT